MFKSIKDIMKIIWSGLKDIKSKCREYRGNEALKLYADLKNAIRERTESPEALRERIIRCRWQLSLTEREITVITAMLILAFSFCMELGHRFGRTAWWMMAAIICLVYLVRICVLYKRKYRLSLELELLAEKPEDGDVMSIFQDS